MPVSRRWGRAVRPQAVERPEDDAPTSRQAVPSARERAAILGTSQDDRLDRLTSLLDQYSVGRNDGTLRLVPMSEPSSTPTSVGAVAVPGRDESVPPLAPTARAADRRRHIAPAGIIALGPARLTRLTCAGCGTPANIDIVDRLNGRVHLSCPTCFRMWQDRVRVEQRVDPTAAMRD